MDLPQIAADASLDEIRAFFKNDQFATRAAGCTLVSAEKGHAIAEMKLSDIHLNGHGNVMGGAIFTLADFCLAVACNVGEAPTVSVNNNIEFISGASGSKLIAECNADKSSRKLGFYTVTVRDDNEKLIAKMTATCYR